MNYSWMMPTDDDCIPGRSFIYTKLVRTFPQVMFEEINPELDYSGDVDYVGKIGERAFGIQVKPVTANASLGNYSVTARMQDSFRQFEHDFGGKVFVIFSVDDHLKNTDILEEIRNEIDRLKSFD